MISVAGRGGASIEILILQRAPHASPFYRSWESRVPVSRAPSHSVDDDRASRDGENAQADVNGTEEHVAIRIAVHRLTDGPRYRRRREK
jgi:hypothetical protein